MRNATHFALFDELTFVPHAHRWLTARRALAAGGGDNTANGTAADAGDVDGSFTKMPDGGARAVSLAVEQDADARGGGVIGAGVYGPFILGIVLGLVVVRRASRRTDAPDEYSTIASRAPWTSWWRRLRAPLSPNGAFV